MTPNAIGGRLFAFDRQIVLNGVRTAFGSWQDRLVAVIRLLVVLGGVRTWFADRPWPIATAVGCAASVLVGISAGRLIASRLAYHAFDGPLAADALHVPTRQRYTLAWHGIGLIVVAAVTLIARAPLAMVSLPGYAAGALIGESIFGFGGSGFTGWTPGYRRTPRSLAQSPRAAIVSAAILSVTLLGLGGVPGTSAMMTVIGVETAILVVLLTMIDDGVVRFLTIDGYGSWRIIARHARGGMLFLGLAAPLCAFGSGAAMAAMVSVIAAAAMLLMTIRILAYRLHSKRAADFIVSVLIALLLLVAYAMPILMPFLTIVLFWQVLRRAATKTWLLA